MIYRIKVWERSNGNPRPAGEMVCESAENGQTRSAFRYEQEYLERPDAYALDPVSLPLKAIAFSTDNSGIFGVFEDSLPDDWGRNLLIRKHRIPRQGQNLPNLLLALGGTGLGALSYSDQATPPRPTPDLSALQLSALVDAAEKFELGLDQDSDIALLLTAGSSPGGARPKAAVTASTSASRPRARKLE